MAMVATTASRSALTIRASRCEGRPRAQGFRCADVSSARASFLRSRAKLGAVTGLRPVGMTRGLVVHAEPEDKAEVVEEETVVVVPAETAPPSSEAGADEEDVVIVEVEVPPFLERLQNVDYMKVGLMAGAGIVGLTLTIALFRTAKKFLTPKAKRKRTVNKNKLLVDKLNEYLPSKRSELTPQATKMLMFQTGFTGTEVFRKFLWYLLRERKFDVDAVTDLSQLKTVLGLSDEQVADALSERSKRIYEKYGALIMNTAGMTAEGATRKATGRALFSKLLYISESEQVLAQDSEAAKGLSVPEIFGATERDTNDLRIVSLYDVDMDKLDQMAQTASADTTDEDINPDKSKS